MQSHWILAVYWPKRCMMALMDSIGGYENVVEKPLRYYQPNFFSFLIPYFAEDLLINLLSLKLLSTMHTVWLWRLEFNDNYCSIIINNIITERAKTRK